VQSSALIDFSGDSTLLLRSVFDDFIRATSAVNSTPASKLLSDKSPSKGLGNKKPAAGRCEAPYKFLKSVSEVRKITANWTLNFAILMSESENLVVDVED
jgi:hypothetical protein